MCSLNSAMAFQIDRPGTSYCLIVIVSVFIKATVVTAIPKIWRRGPIEDWEIDTFNKHSRSSYQYPQFAAIPDNIYETKIIPEEKRFELNNEQYLEEETTKHTKHTTTTHRPWPTPSHLRGEDVAVTKFPPSKSLIDDFYFIAIAAGCCAAAIIGLIGGGICWYRLHKNAKAAAEAEYPAYGVTGPNKETPTGNTGDRKLAQSAQMYHYQHQKQQMIALEKANGEMKPDISDEETDEENEEGNYTVYECPGLAPTGEMEVKNPLFIGDTSPVQSPPPHDKKEPEK